MKVDGLRIQIQNESSHKIKILHSDSFTNENVKFVEGLVKFRKVFSHILRRLKYFGNAFLVFCSLAENVFEGNDIMFVVV